MRSYLDFEKPVAELEVRDRIGKRKELCEMVYPETKTTKAGGPGRAKTRGQNGDDIAERFTKDTAKRAARRSAPSNATPPAPRRSPGAPRYRRHLTRQGRRDRRTGGKG
jgi:hypothetical protein